MRIRAAVLEAPGEPMRFSELELDEPEDDELIVRITSAGICHTDIGIQPHVPTPIVLGHEGTGIVERCGAAVSSLSVGDRVALTFGSCGGCRNCTAGLPSHCFDMFGLNLAGYSRHGDTTLRSSNGGAVHGSFFYQSSFASHALVNERNAIRLPQDAQQAYLGPLGCGVQTGAGAVLNTLAAKPGTSIVCFGVGAVGLSAVMAARLAGCDNIIAVDLIDARLKMASELGAHHSLLADETIDEAIRDLTAGGADYSIDSAGTVQTFHSTIASVRMGGHAALAAVPNWADGFHFQPEALALGRTVTGVLEGSSRPASFIPRLYEWFRQGQLPIDRLVTLYPFSRINEAMDDLAQGRVIKPVVVMDETIG